jgi:ABC-type transport system involved in multi-copper enzyme maturation permease subunit
MTAFWLELKSVCKSYRFLAFILVLLFFLVLNIQQYRTESAIVNTKQTEDINSFLSISQSGLQSSESRYESFMAGDPLPKGDTEERRINMLIYCKHRLKIAEALYKAYYDQDWPAYNRYMAERALMKWNVDVKDYNVLSPELYFGERWNQYQALIEYVPEIFYSNIEQNTPYTEWIIFSTDYHLRLITVDLPPQNPNDTSPWGFTFNFLRRGLPDFLGLIVLLMTVSLLHRDRKTGTVKSTLLTPKNRSYYLFKKTTLGFLASILVIIIPLLITFLVLGINSGFRGMESPVIMDKGLWKLAVVPEHGAIAKTGLDPSGYGEVGMSQFVASYGYFSNLDRLEFVPLWQFLSLAAILVIMFILFCTVIGIFISTLVRNEILAQIVAVGVFALGSSLGTLLPGIKTTYLDLFAKVNAVPILEGNHATTYLGSLSILFVMIIILFRLSVLVFKRQDICD